MPDMPGITSKILLYICIAKYCFIMQSNIIGIAKFRMICWSAWTSIQLMTSWKTVFWSAIIWGYFCAHCLQYSLTKMSHMCSDADNMADKCVPLQCPLGIPPPEWGPQTTSSGHQTLSWSDMVESRVARQPILSKSGALRIMRVK